MNMRTLSLTLLALALIAVWPTWHHGLGLWDYLPSATIAVAFSSIVVLFLARRI